MACAIERLAVEVGSTTKTWKTVGNGHVRDSHAEMEGVTIPIGDEFEVGGERLFLPGDPSASLEETANCRCYVAYGMEDMTEQEDVQLRETPQEEAAQWFRGNRRFIYDREGGLWTNGYVPEDEDGEPIGNSGVTIGPVSISVIRRRRGSVR